MLEVIIIFLLGLFIGSFLNVLADRLPREESIIKGRSRCDRCKKKLVWYDLIPLLSFIFLRGKCRYCKAKLSFYYPFVEIVTGVLFIVVFVFVNQGSIMYQVSSIKYVWELFYYLFIVSSLIVIFFADLKYGIIPDKVVFPAIFVSFLYIFFNPSSLIINHFFSAAGASLFFLFLFLITRGKGMGFGDVKFAFLMGLVLGFPNIIVSLYIAFLTGAIVGCILIIWKKKRVFGTAVSFGPFLVLGTFLALFWGENTFQAIMSVLR